MKLDIGDLKKRFQTRAALAITLESARTVITVVRRGPEAAEGYREVVLPIGAEAVVADPAKAGKALAEILQTERIRERRCVVSVPPGWAMSTTGEVPEMTAEDLRGFMELRAEREFPSAVSDLRIAYDSYRAPDGKDRATLVALPAKRVAAIEQMLEEAGCKAISISLGLDACLNNGSELGAVHFLSNCDHVDVVVTASGGIAAIRSLAGPVASSEVPFDAANFCREVRITLGRLPEPVRQQVRQAHFSGASRASETLCRSTRDHLQRLGIRSEECVPAANPEDLGPGAAVQAAERVLSGESVTFEFAPRTTPKWQAIFQRADSQRKRMIIGGVALLIVLPILVLMIRSKIESNLETEWNGMRSNVTELEGLQQRIRQFRPWFDSTPHSLQIMEALVGAFPEQGDVWAKSIQISTASKVTCTGFARSQAVFMAMLDRLRSMEQVTDLQVLQVRGESPVEFSISYKIAGASE
ncbi:MAG: hypothetical protein ACO1QR_14450 [Chthoniobacteraceae bacterium]